MSQRILSIGTTSTTINNLPSDTITTTRDKMLLIAYLLLSVVSASASVEAAVINQGAGYEPIQQLVNEKLVAQQQQQNNHNQHHHTATANDLQEFSEPKPPRFGQRPMINGNHATYVEPPADFKPIIYETSDFSSINQLQGSGSDAGVGGQLEQEQPSGGLNWAGSELKPSIGRWSDWHDMSIEPDLASSDSSPSGVAVEVAPPSVTYRTRYYASTRSKNGKTTERQQEEAAPVSSNQANAASGQEFQIKSGQLAPLTWSQQRLLQSQPRQLEATRTKLPLKLISQPSMLAVAAAQQQQQMPKIEHNPHLHLNLNHATPAAAWANHNQQQNANHKHNQSHLQSQMAQQVQQQVQQQQRRGLKHRRKSKSNAEMRIQQLVAASQLQQQQQQLQNQFQHQQLPLMREAGRNKQVNGLSGAFSQLNQLKEHPKQHQLHQSQHHQLQRVSSQLVRSSTQTQATVLKRFAGNPSQANLTTAARPRSSGVTQQRRRRIKTLLPVGLSSWFLGGIRDLDGRHWHLPGEVINRLTVNDVDFGPRPAPEVEQSLAELTTARPHNSQAPVVQTNNTSGPDAIPR